MSFRVVKAFVRSGHEEEKFAKANGELLTAGLNAVMRIILMMPLMLVILNSASLGVFWFGGNMVVRGTMLTGELYSFYMYIAQVLMSVLMVAMCLLQLTRATACAQRIDEVLETQPDICDGRVPENELPPALGKVEFKNVSFRYNMESDKVLSHINLKIPKGAYYALVGSSGAGKTTLCSLIPRFYEATEGTIFVDGYDIKSLTLKSLRDQIGMVQQDVYLFAGTIYENILYGRPNATEEEVYEAAKNANAHDFIMSLPNGYQTDIGQRGIKLSGGQKQRLSIARVFLKNPPILIFDEATSALDNESEKVVQESLEKLAKDRTTLVIAHRLTTIENAQRILVLTEDGIAEEGTHEELLEKGGIYQKLYQIHDLGITN